MPKVINLILFFMFMGKITDFMSKDHDKLDALFETFQNTKSKDIAKAKEIYNKFKKGLERHIIWEEEILFPKFDEKYNLSGSGPTYAMKEEHKQIKALLSKIEADISSSDGAETDLLSVLGMHNHKEEMMLYPGIDQALNTKETEEVLAKLSE